MGKILVIAEKPSVARDIAKVLQAKQKGEGRCGPNGKNSMQRSRRGHSE